ncbi:MAG: hypothetical protein KA988_02265 [Longilinea sp.]|nr:hypothetical protein [Longilinea sp.]MCA1954556.1 hypothetical protein [Anaerolinea sp.]
MAVQTFATGAAPVLEVTTEGDLFISGWEQAEVLVDGGAETAAIRRMGDDFQIRLMGDCLLKVPLDARLTVTHATGDVNVRRLKGALVVKEVSGDVLGQELAEVSAEQIGGDCDLATVEGEVTIRSLGGDFLGFGLQGRALLDGVGGDCDVLLAAELVVNAGGDVDARWSELPAGQIVIKAGGDVEARLTANPDVSMTLVSGSEDIEVEIGDFEDELDQAQYMRTFGSGATHLVIEAGGDVSVSDRSVETERWWRVFERAERRWDEVERRMAERLRKVDERAERAAQRAEEISRRVEERMRAAMERTDRRRRSSAWGVGPVPPVPPVPPVAPVSPVPPTGRTGRVSEEERSLILQMLQDKQISAEEAERLLEALEGLQ